MVPSDQNILKTEELESMLMDRMLRKVDAGRANLIKIKTVWSRVAGNIANHSMPVEIRGEQLIVRTEHSIYQQELRMHSVQILATLNAYLKGLVLKSMRVERGKVVWNDQEPQQTNSGPSRDSVLDDNNTEQQPAGDRLEDLL